MNYQNSTPITGLELSDRPLWLAVWRGLKRFTKICKFKPQEANFLESNIGKAISVGNYQPDAFGFYDVNI